jgi:hypothetical protein
MEMDQRFTADVFAKTNVVSRIKRAIGCDGQPLITCANNLFPHQDNMNIDVLTMVLRALFGQRARFAFGDGKKRLSPSTVYLPAGRLSGSWAITACNALRITGG